MRNPDLSKIVGLLEKQEEFELTDIQYKRKTGAEIPKDKSYTEKRSAVAKKAKEYGFEIEVIPKRIIFHPKK